MYNEEDSIRSTVDYIIGNVTYKRLLKEVIVVDGGSTDRTIAEAEKAGATVLRCQKNERAALLNHGGRYASGEILYFLPAHARPPKNFITQIVKAWSKGYACGTFSLQFNYQHWLLNILSWCTKHTSKIHVSDQSLFLTKELFDKSGGFRTDHYVMANQEMIKRLKRYTNFVIIKDNIISSAGKYLRHGIFRTEFVHVMAYVMNKVGFRQETITRFYRQWMGWRAGSRKNMVENITPAKSLRMTQTVSLK